MPDKHTAGPWFTDGCYIWAGSDEGGGKVIGLRKSGTAYDPNTGETRQYNGGCSPTEADSNAHLMAAAPELEDAILLLGGGIAYLEDFGRLCFCHKRNKVARDVDHSMACSAVWHAWQKAEGLK